MTIRRASFVTLLLVLGALVAPARAASTRSSGSSGQPLGWYGWGVRLGATSDADQIVGGAHANLGDLFRNVRFQPDVLLGTGDDLTTLYGTAPLYYRFHRSSTMTPYAGGGLALGYVDYDGDLPANDDSEFEVGARATGGLEWSRRPDETFLVELSLGIGDVHDLQVVAAWCF